MKYLREVRIENFRGYGPSFRIEVPFSHGVVLLSGANGLGKTSLFEAVEWALTGRVARLEQLTRELDPAKLEIVRRGEAVDACHVALHFQDGDGSETVIHRGYAAGARSSVRTGMKVDDVAGYLAAEERWSVTGENLHDYLFLTHFHPQAARQRLVAMRAQERWGWFTHLAGTTRLELARSQLVKAKRSLTEIKRERERELREAEVAERRWREDIDRLAEQRRRAVALGDAMEPDEILRQLRELCESVGVEFESQASDVSELAQHLAATLAVREERAAARQRTVEGLRDLVGAWIRLSSQAQARDGVVRGLEADLSAARKLIEEAEGELQVAGAAQRLAETRQEERTAELDSLARGLENLEALQTTTEELQRLRSLERDLEKRQADAEAASVAAQKAVSDRRLAEKRIARLEERLARLDEAVAAHEQLQLIEKEHVVSRRTLERSRADAEGIGNQVAELALQRTALDENRAALEQRTAELRARENRVAEAAAVIAEALADDAEVCPVCNASYEAGELLRRAHEAVRASDPAVAQALAELEATRKEQAAIEDTERRLHAEQKRALARVAATQSILRELEERRSELVSIPLLQEIRRDRVPAEVETMRAAALVELAAAQVAMAEAPDARLLAGEVEKTASRRASVEETYDELRQRGSVLKTRVAEARARIAYLREKGLPATSPEIEEHRAQAAHELEVAREARRAANARASAASDAVSRAREVVADLETRAQVARAELAEIRDELGRRESDWNHADYKGVPNSAILDEVTSQLIEEGQQLAAAGRRLQKLRNGLGQWLAEADTRRLERRLAEAAGTVPLEEHWAVLRGRAADCAKSLSAASTARSTADALSAILQRETEAFNTRVLRPADNVFKSYLRTLVQDERFQSVGLESRSKARAGELHFRLDGGDWGEDGPEAEVMLSEGQIAEVSLAALFAASSAYRWCSWRALLLDDPTQYNDLIHITAFLEVVRGLVYFGKYQVVLSTHDGQQAAFFQRKLKGLGIPCVECRYLGIGENGIEYDIRQG